VILTILRNAIFNYRNYMAWNTKWWSQR